MNKSVKKTFSIFVSYILLLSAFPLHSACALETEPDPLPSEYEETSGPEKAAEAPAELPEPDSTVTTPAEPDDGETDLPELQINEYTEMPVTEQSMQIENPDNPDSLCRIAFVSNGGTETEDQYVEEGNAARKPDDPVKENGIFQGWYLDDGTFLEPYDFSSEVIYPGLTLFAKWEESQDVSSEYSAAEPPAVAAPPTGFDNGQTDASRAIIAICLSSLIIGFATDRRRSRRKEGE